MAVDAIDPWDFIGSLRFQHIILNVCGVEGRIDHPPMHGNIRSVEIILQTERFVNGRRFGERDNDYFRFV